MGLAIEATHSKPHVSSRLLRLSRQMEHERLTIGSEADLRRDAEEHLSDFQRSRARANSTLENDSATEPL